MLNRLADTCRIPVDDWTGKCYIIAMTLLACENGDGELVTGFYHSSHGMVADHAWVEYPDGNIADPTRWTMEFTRPEIYRGKPTRNYDRDGRRWEAELDEMKKPIVQAGLLASRFRAALLASEILEDLKEGG